MPDLPLTERVRSYMARQRAWLERELADAEELLAHPEELQSLDHTLQSAKNAQWELENLEREQRGLLAEWQGQPIDAEARTPILMEAAAIAELAAKLGIARGQVAQAIAQAQVALSAEQQSLRAGKMRMRKYAPLEEITGMNIDLTRPLPPHPFPLPPKTGGEGDRSLSASDIPSIATPNLPPLHPSSGGEGRGEEGKHAP